jgi:predicted branched-subunit amino acid permease
MGSPREPGSDVRAGVRAAIPVALPTMALGISYGLLARPVMGAVAPTALSVLIFSGGAQFAALGVLAGGGSAAAAAGAGLLMNTRWLPMSFAVAPSLRGGTARRAVESQAIVDASFVIASRPDGSFDRNLLLGATLPQASAWILGTAIGVLGSGLVDDPDQFGLDAIFPAFYLALLVGELRRRRRGHAAVAAVLAGVITVGLMPVSAPGVPILAASAAALVGLRGA